MSELEDVMEVGADLIEERHGEFEDRPDEFDLKSGLMDDGMAAYTKSDASMVQDGPMVMFGPTVEPEEIVLDQELAEDFPKRAAKSLIHELFEWRAAETMPTHRYLEGSTHTVAEWNENSVCEAVNEEFDEEVCDQDWNNEFTAVP